MRRPRVHNRPANGGRELDRADEPACLLRGDDHGGDLSFANAVGDSGQDGEVHKVESVSMRAGLSGEWDGESTRACGG